MGIEVQWRIAGTPSTFDSSSFSNGVAAVLKIDPKRIRIVKTAAGSVIVNFVIDPPLVTKPNEFTAAESFTTLQLLPPSAFRAYNITPLNPPVDFDTVRPNVTSSTNASGVSGSVLAGGSTLSGGAIAGITIGVVAVVAALIVALILVARMKRKTVDSQLELIDLNKINLTGVKKSLVNYDVSQIDTRDISDVHQELSDKERIGAGAFGIV